MADRTLGDLKYGHLGHAAYDSSSKSWLFSRNPSQDGHLKILGAAQTAVPGTRSPNFEADASVKSARSLERAFKLATFQNPDLAPLEIPELVTSGKLSEEVELLSDIPSQSRELLAFGQILDSDPRKHESSVNVAAFPSGVNRSILKIAKVEKNAKGWNDSKCIALSIPELSGVDSSQWDFNGAAIEQIAFASFSTARGRGTFLGVQTRLQSTVFRPQYKSSDVTTLLRPPPGIRPEPSSLDLNPIFTLSAEHTEGQPHAAITFNPWYHRSFALVTERGLWYVWDIEGRTGRRNALKISPTASGSLLDGRKLEPGGQAKFFGDSWARILWVADVNTVAVCCRRGLTIFDIADRCQSLRCDGILIGSNEWILDIKRDPLRDDQLHILTTTRLLLITIRRTVSPNDDPTPQFKYRIVSSWQHFRNSEDTSCSLSITRDDQGMVIKTLRIANN
jgi:RNA polymerase I-specific transcription initiation factor RRN6